MDLDKADKLFLGGIIFFIVLISIAQGVAKFNCHGDKECIGKLKSDPSDVILTGTGALGVGQ